MKKRIFASVSNVIFVFIITFLFFSVLTSKSFNHPLNLLFGLFIALFVLLFSILIAKKRISSHKIKATRESKINKIITALSFISKRKGLMLFYSQILKFDEKAKLYQNKIVLSGGENVFNLFGFSSPTKTDLVRCFNLSHAKPCIVLCDKAPKEVKDFANAFKGKMQIYESDRIFKKLSPDDFKIEENAYPVDFMKKDRPSFRVYLKRKNAKKFIAFGLIFIFLSFFVPIKLYYLIVGGLMLVYATTLLFFGKKEV